MNDAEHKNQSDILYTEVLHKTVANRINKRYTDIGIIPNNYRRKNSWT